MRVRLQLQRPPNFQQFPPEPFVHQRVLQASRLLEFCTHVRLLQLTLAIDGDSSEKNLE